MGRFELGQIVMTHGIDEAIKDAIRSKNYEFYNYMMECMFQRYVNCDWGDMCEEDLKTNDDALKYGERLFASYDVPEEIRFDGHDKFWIITEWDRSVTTILFPEEY